MASGMLALGSYVELAVSLLRALYDAKNDEQYRLREAALLKTMEADRLVALAAKASGRPTHNGSNMNSENARTRRSRTRAAGRASAQAAKDSAAEAKALWCRSARALRCHFSADRDAH